jgi:hypothetical protein
MSIILFPVFFTVFRSAELSGRSSQPRLYIRTVYLVPMSTYSSCKIVPDYLLFATITERFCERSSSDVPAPFTGNELQLKEVVMNS